jgi:iron complex outermembrane receptor protein
MRYTGTAGTTIAVLGLAGLRLAHLGLAVLGLAGSAALTVQAQPALQIPQVTVAVPPAQVGYAANPQYHTDAANLGPLGNRPILDTPASVTVVPEDLLVNQHAATVNQALGYLPSVVLNDQQGYEVSRPQSL